MPTTANPAVWGLELVQVAEGLARGEDGGGHAGAALVQAVGAVVAEVALDVAARGDREYDRAVWCRASWLKQG